MYNNNNNKKLSISNFIINKIANCSMEVCYNRVQLYVVELINVLSLKTIKNAISKQAFTVKIAKYQQDYIFNFT